MIPFMSAAKLSKANPSCCKWGILVTLWRMGIRRGTRGASRMFHVSI